VLVSEKGSPDPGIITPTGICGLYQATLRRIIQFQILYGRGEGARGLLPQVIRKRVQKWSMSKIDPNDIPEELRAV
jgi:hypothetical protein